MQDEQADSQQPDSTAGTKTHRVALTHVVHRVAHAIYGLIILAAVVGELSAHDESMGTAIVIVAAGGIVLVFAHTYSQFVATASMSNDKPEFATTWTTLVDQLALAVPATLAVVVFALGNADVISDRAAYNVVLGGSLLSLFGLGIAIGIHRHKSTLWSLGIGLANAFVGFAVISIEAASSH